MYIIKLTLIVVCVNCLIMFSSCMNRCPELSIAIRNSECECGNTELCDSVHAKFRLRNVSADTIRLMLVPECDCTTLNADSLVLAPYSHATICADAKLNYVGEYVKYIFVQKEDSEFFLTLSIHGNAISTE